jgi:hypothetical protein
VLWIKKNIKDIQVPYDQPVSIMCDNTSAINLSKNHVQHFKTKHIPIKYHFLRERVQDHVIKLEYHVPSKEKIAHIFTKPLPREPFDYAGGDHIFLSFIKNTIHYFEKFPTHCCIREKFSFVEMHIGEVCNGYRWYFF